MIPVGRFPGFIQYESIILAEVYTRIFLIKLSIVKSTPSFDVMLTLFASSSKTIFIILMESPRKFSSSMTIFDFSSPLIPDVNKYTTGILQRRFTILINYEYRYFFRNFLFAIALNYIHVIVIFVVHVRFCTFVVHNFLPNFYFIQY